MIWMACGSWNRNRDLARYAQLERGSNRQISTIHSFRSAMCGDAKVVVVMLVVMRCSSSVMHWCQGSFGVNGVPMPNDMLARGCRRLRGAAESIIGSFAAVRIVALPSGHKSAVYTRPLITHIHANYSRNRLRAFFWSFCFFGHIGAVQARRNDIHCILGSTCLGKTCHEQEYGFCMSTPYLYTHTRQNATCTHV